jgi:long-chain acyl-CoA synthetase
VTYGRLASRVVAAAGALRDLGVQPGDRVVLAAAGTPAFAYAYLATHLVGAVAVPLAPDVPAPRRDLVIERARPRLAFATRPFAHERLGPVRSLASLAEAPEPTEGFPDPDPGATADLLFTTGTSGLPKGVALTHANVLAGAVNINQTIGNGRDDREVVPLPFSHSFGLGRLRCVLLAGGTLLPVPGFRLPGEVFRALEAGRATGLAGVPAGFAILLRYEEELARHADRLRYVEIGSAPMSLEHKRRLRVALPRTRLFMHYGLTEATRSAFVELHEAGERLDSIGRPTVNVDVRVVDRAGVEVPPGVRGEIVVRGATVAQGYWEDPDLTRRVFVDGWLRTGDVGRRDADGFLYLEGREDDMINVGGFNVAPAEVERALEAHPAVERAACVGVPDPQGVTGQAVKAFLVGRPETARPAGESLAGFLRGRVEDYKIPTRWEWLDALPETSSGKVQRAVLRRREEDVLPGRAP